MSLEKLKEQAVNYSLADEKVEQKENDRLSFVEKFTLDKLQDLSIDQFVQGTDENSFCYWLEFKKIGFGIGGGNASKFGIYKTKNNEEVNYATGYGKNKTYLDNKAAREYYSALLNKILKALDCAKNDEIAKIKELEIPMWNMVLQKILALYYPDKFLAIGSSKVLIKCANELEIENLDLSSENTIQINYECKKAISNNPQFAEWSYWKIGAFIWETFDRESEKRKSKSRKRYWIYSPGANADLWDEFYRDGIMGLGWDEIGDLSQYTNRDEIKKALIDSYGGTGTQKNNVSANDDFINKVKIGDVIIAKKGRKELLGYGIVTSDYAYDKNRVRYQKFRHVDWKLKDSWKIDFSLALKTLTDITKYASDHADYDTYYEKLLGIMGVGKTQKDNKGAFNSWLIKKYGKESGTPKSYLKAIDILSEILSKKLFKITNDSYLDSLYKDLIKEQGNHEGEYYHSKAPSYGNNGFYSASIKSYREFLKSNKTTQTHNENKMGYPLNTILYGPPGTGKTYNTILRAAQIIEDREINSYDEALGIFKSNLHNQIEFITFHQNYSYEDFIQGLRPDTENDSQLTFERKDGIFKEIADKALKNLRESEEPQLLKKPFEEVFYQFILPLVEGEIEEIEVKMKKVSFFITAISNKSIEFRKASGGTAHTLSIGTLKKMYLAESVLDIQGLSSYYTPLLTELLKLGKDGTYKKEQINRKHYVIIIDEINRANISRVFGELITLIEPDKRSHGKIPMEARLPSGDTFVVPSNLYTIGTMNTADKSIALLDIALRRRFEFEPMYPKYTEDGLDVRDDKVLKSINESIVSDKGHDFQIGHSYFMDSKEDPYNFKRRMNVKVIPLFLEYFMNDSKAVIQIITKALSQTQFRIETKSWPLRIIEKND